MIPPIPAYPIANPIRMESDGPWPAAVHRFTAATVAALQAAEATGRPLLIRGKPGVGKSMTARAAAYFAKRPLLTRVIDARTEPEDLKAHFDTVRRLADAQLRRNDEALPSEAHYLEPRQLWWAFDWQGAMNQHAKFSARLDSADKDASRAVANHPPEWSHESDRAILLLDEIDKADPELPNALLEAFSNNGFLVPVTGHTVLCPPERRPLLIVTTNEERDLPNAFLRRCLVLWIALPDDDDALVDELIAIGTEHQEWLLDARHGNNRRRGACKVIREAAQAVASRRYELRDGSYQPGTSEFLDLVAALAQLAPDDEPRQREMLETLKDFVLRKSPEPPG